MNVEIFTLCDAATVSGGKMNLLGSYDTIAAREFPCQHPLCALATKIRFDLGEEGEHTMQIRLCDPDMRQVLGPVDQQFQVEINDLSAVHFHVWNIFGFTIEQPGEYYFELKMDGATNFRVPLYVRPAPQDPAV